MVSNEMGTQIIISGKYGRIWKEMVLVYSKAWSQHSPGRAEETTKIISQVS
jgi:hypothetical protein